jgi:hypothetical protein
MARTMSIAALKFRRLLASCLILLLVACNFEKGYENSVAENKRRGEVVIRHLELYRTRFHAYPASLQELETRLMVVVPRPTAFAASRWIYSTDADTFQLAFTTDLKREYPIWYYTSAEHEWHDDQ